ncbi:hypothetical protein [Micromonospora rubida]
MTWRGWHVLVVVLLTAVLAAGTALIAAQRAGRAAEVSARQMCGVVVALDDAYREAPPQTPAGQRIADSIAALRTEFGCP